MEKNKSQNFFSNPWVVGIGTTILSVFVLRIIDRITGSTITTTILNWLSSTPMTIWNFLLEAYHIPFYGLVIVFLSGPLTLIGILWLLSFRGNKEEQNLNIDSTTTPNWLNYKQDNFHGVQYRWSYELNSIGKYEISSIRPFCPKCNCLIINNRCPNCDTSYYWALKGEDEIKALIFHRLELQFSLKV